MQARPRTARARKTILVTGAAGFIGYHLSAALLAAGWRVIGVDAYTPYYDPRLKRKRVALLAREQAFRFERLDLARYAPLERLLREVRPVEVVHLAAQPGVRYSLTDPGAYVLANDLGTVNVFEAARRLGLPRVVYASSSSVYGANEPAPMRETDRVDRPVSVYAATKRANELMAHAYHHLYGLELVGLRFFTVYGTWYRPDLALFKFTKRILAGEPIDLYNRGEMARSFTHSSDIIAGIERVLARRPAGRLDLYNLGGAASVPLLAFVELIERAAGTRAKKRLLPMQPGDVPETIADWSKAHRELGFTPAMPIEDGIAEFVRWFRAHEPFLRSLREAKQ
jgi:UDP-glucuronate 4-epimerase